MQFPLDLGSVTVFAGGQLVEVHSPGADKADDDVVANGIDEQEHDDASYRVHEDLLVVFHQGVENRKGGRTDLSAHPPRLWLVVGSETHALNGAELVPDLFDFTVCDPLVLLDLA